MMKNNLIAFGLTLLAIVSTVLLASVLYQFDMIREVLLVMWIVVLAVWVFLSIRSLVNTSIKNQTGVIKRGKEWEV
jgi:cobalamin biosynthesis protein CobD/CbiB